MRTRFAACAISVALVAPAIAADAQMIVNDANGSVNQVADRLTAAAEKAGAMIVARVDHAQNAASVDTDMAPTTVVIFGNPKIGTPIIMSDKRAGLDLPIRVLIWKEGDRTKIGYLDPAVLAERYDLDETAKESVRKMTGALEKLTAAAAKQ